MKNRNGIFKHSNSTWFKSLLRYFWSQTWRHPAIERSESTTQRNRLLIARAVYRCSRNKKYISSNSILRSPSVGLTQKYIDSLTIEKKILKLGRTSMSRLIPSNPRCVVCPQFPYTPRAQFASFPLLNSSICVRWCALLPLPIKGIVRHPVKNEWTSATNCPTSRLWFRPLMSP